MSAIHGVEGLIKWIKRDEWRSDFEAVFDRHVGSACRGAGVELEELADIIGDHGMTVLWGCAFEDFVSSGSGERNVADEYLKRRGWKESAGARAYIRALRTSVMSLYEVSDVVVGESFLARDLVRGGEPVRVFERSATRSLSQWDRIAARVVTVLGKTQISGAALPFSHPLAEEAVASIERVRKKARAEAGKLAKSLGRNVDEIDFAAVTGLEEVLASSESERHGHPDRSLGLAFARCERLQSLAGVGQKFVQPAMGVAKGFDQDRARVSAHRAGASRCVARALDDLAPAIRRRRRPWQCQGDFALSSPSASSDRRIWIAVPPIATRSIRSRMSVCEAGRSADSLPTASVTSASTSAAGTRTIDPVLLLSPCRAACET